eukprot:CAMPEP_0176425616 /NCGR_PEP_ID=MMETSP0127-20121128/11484_1 /TAXON_ID=938130 /ORGANISM="Platyophrya macrostoma, Strain WH" /LENGTH=788 /DNA_ID=CAMNT_0017806789 /DNA_START=42 /DNA_END=2408 /DNA_ORIENTATION=+
MSVAAAIGIDLGSQTIVIGCAKKGGVEIMVNEGSNRETPFVVGYGPAERYVGEQAASQFKSNFKNTVAYPFRFLGMKGDSPHLGQESKFIYNKLTTLADNRVGFSVTHNGEAKTFLPEQIVATMLQKLKDIVRKNEIGHSDFVLTCPSYFTEQERRALLDAAKLADVNVVRLLNEHAAIALAYGIFRKAELTADPRNVLFVDVGHSSTSVFLASFTKEKVTIIDQHHERHLGSRDIDWVVMDFYANMFNQANGLNPIKSEKARLRLFDAIEKQRKVLSANSEASVNLEYLMEDCDLNHTLTREQYEQMMTPFLTKLKDTLSKINTSKYNIHSVEIIGGATRIPSVQKTIQEVYGQTLFKTLNSTECIARGAAIQAAIVSPLFKVSDYILEEANYYPIRCAWKFLENPQAYSENKMDIEDPRNNPIKQRSILFDAGCNVPSVKAVSFHKEDAVEFRLFYDPVPIGAQEVLATYVIHNPKPKETEFKVKLRVHLTRDGIVEFDSAQMIEEWEEDEEKPAPKEGEKKDEAAANEPPKKKRKSRSSDLKTDIVFKHGLNQAQINQYFEEECQLANNDRVILETYHKKNELESYIYDLRGKVADRYKKYVDNNTAESFMNLLSENEQWLYGDGLKTTKAAYAQKLEGLRKIGDPIEKRAQEYESVPEHIQNLITLTDNVTETLAPNNEKIAHVTAEERKPVLDLAAQTKQWAYNAIAALDKAVRTSNPPVTTHEVTQKFHELQNKANPVIHKPKPEPPKEQPKKEEKTEEAKKNDEMKDERDEKPEANMDIEK